MFNNVKSEDSEELVTKVQTRRISSFSPLGQAHVECGSNSASVLANLLEVNQRYEKRDQRYK